MPADAALLHTFVTSADISAAMGTSAAIGFAYAGDKFVGSVQRDGTNVLYTTDLTGGGVTPFCNLREPRANLCFGAFRYQLARPRRFSEPGHLCGERQRRYAYNA